MRVSYLLLLSYMFSLVSYGQKKSTHTKINTIKGDLLLDSSKKIVHNHYYKTITENNKPELLRLDKHLDLSKEIKINYGNGIKESVMIDWLQYQGVRIKMEGKGVIVFTVKKGQLFINCTVFGIDGNYIAKVENNKLLPNNDVEQYISSSWLEIISKQDIPVLQIELDKVNNSINIYGLFFSDSWVTFMTKKNGMLMYPMGTPFMLMTNEQRSKISYEVLKKAREYLVAFHNEK